MNKQNLTGKRILLTGATGSLGCETALALARMDAELLLPIRNPSKAKALQNKLLQACPEAHFHFYPLDMADEASVNQLALQLRNENKPLDAIIHNAGVFTKAGQVSPQGQEWHQQVNALSPMLLTEQLLPLLYKAREPVVETVTSLSAFWGQGKQSPSSPTRLYAASKRNLLVKMNQLSHQHPSIRFVYAHPGVCATGLFTGATHQTAYNRQFLKIALPLMKAIFPSPEKACAPIVAALLDGANGELTEPGGLLHIWGKPKQVSLTNRLRILSER